MNIVMFVTALLVAFVIHEAAHALVVRKLGVPISEAGLGLPIPPQARIRHRRIPFDLMVSPWLLGAYVRPHPDHQHTLDELPYRPRAWYLNAGIVVNLVAWMALWAAAYALEGRALPAVGYLTAAAAVWAARHLVAAYLLPALALPVLALTVFSLTLSWHKGETGFGFAGALDAAPAAGSSIATIIAFFGSINLIVALFNTLPLFGLDNGRTVSMIVQRWAGPRVNTAYQVTGACLLLLSVVLAVGTDLWVAAKSLIG